MFIINFCLNMFRASLCPSAGEQRPCYCMWCTALVLLDVVGSGCRALRCRMRAVLAYQLLSQHVSGIIMPIFRRTKAVCYCIRCTAVVLLNVVGSVCGALRCRMRALIAYQLLSQHVSGIIMPIFRRTKAVCYCIRCTALVLLDMVGSGCRALRCRMRAVLPYQLLSQHV